MMNASRLVNFYFKHFERLEAIMMKIELYKAIDAPNEECVKVAEFLLLLSVTD